MTESQGGNDAVPLPTPADFLLRSPLYEFYRFTESDYKTIDEMVYFPTTLDAHCVYCRKHSIFERRTPSTAQGKLVMTELMKTRNYDVGFVCSRDSGHTMWFRVAVMLTYHREGEKWVPHSEIGKTGQWPSVASLHEADVGKYRKLLGDRYSELTRAIGLASHGVGIGSFVYLRRIFESLIDAAREKAKADDPKFAEDEYAQARMDEKILLLRAYLPSFLVENRQLYSILSTGIHALTERECLQYFDTVRTGIELILDERLEEQQRAEKIKKASADITRARGEIKG